MKKSIAKEDIINIIQKVLKVNLDFFTDKETDLSQIGIDSIKFIQLVVSLEEEFDCEIPDSKLLFSEMNTVNKIYQILTSLD